VGLLRSIDRLTARGDLERDRDIGQLRKRRLVLLFRSPGETSAWRFCFEVSVYYHLLVRTPFHK
jgi:hypothetical protein